MNVFESILSAFYSLTSNKMRSILTMLGIIIGISAVIMITSIGIGFQNSMRENIEGMGLDGLQLYAKRDKELQQSDYLTLDDTKILKSHPNVKNVSSYFWNRAHFELRNPEETEPVSVIGVTSEYNKIQNIKIKYGRFLTEQDIENNSYVVIIDEGLSTKIFGRQNSIGESIRAKFWFGTVDLTVVGITEQDDLGMLFSMESSAYIPVSTIMEMHNWYMVDYFFITLKDKTLTEKTALELTKLIEIAHQNEDMYYLTPIMQGADEIYAILSGITLFVAIVAFISFIVGGIGVMNIMLVTVTERTREIGIRKSLGATNGNITFQFLVEAIILTTLGGIIGIVLGYSGAFAVSGAINIVPSIYFPIVIGSVLASSIVGIIFGVYPAMKAAKLDPIEALRYE